MASYFQDNEDLRFYFDRGIDWAPLVEVTEYGFRTKDGYKTADEALTFYREVAQLVGKLAAEEVAPQAAQIDRDGTHLSGGEAVVSPAMSRLFERIKALELHRLCIPRELGGLNAPLLLYFLNAEMLARADVSVMTHHSFHGGMAMAMLAYSIHEGTTTFDKDNACLANTRFGRAIDDHRRRLKHAVRAEVGLPCEAKRADVGGRHVRERGVMRLARIAARVGPVVRGLRLLRRRVVRARLSASGKDQRQTKRQSLHSASHGLGML